LDVNTANDYHVISIRASIDSSIH